MKNADLNLAIIGAAACPAGDWMQWPENEPWSLEFLRALSASQEGASTIPECLLAASGISVGNEESWYLQWKRLADDSVTRAITAQRDDKQRTAQNNWLRASHYYRTAESQIVVNEPVRIALLKQMQSCSREFLACLSPKGENVRIPRAKQRFLDAYFLPAPGQSERSPVVICLGGAGHVKDDHLFRLPRHARARGLSLLMVELPGQGLGWAGQPRYAREVEDAVAACLDYVVRRDDVDIDCIGVFGDGLGAAFASRAAASDPRIRAAVCDAGIWDLLERAFVERWLSKGATRAPRKEVFATLGLGIARKIGCPIFVVLGKQEALNLTSAAELCDVLRKSGSDLTVKILDRPEAGLICGQIESPTISNEVVFDWLKERLGVRIPFAAKASLGEASSSPARGQHKHTVEKSAAAGPRALRA